ncbi:MAG TPA: hypothetical protein VN428_22025 [Bryobacteraceae bacterium]|nr:hypothetical protein [Bryobacteraceae bacterium]
MAGLLVVGFALRLVISGASAGIGGALADLASGALQAGVIMQTAYSAPVIGAVIFVFDAVAVVIRARRDGDTELPEGKTMHEAAR